MSVFVLIHPDDDAYPLRLANLSKKPTLRTSGPLPHQRHAIAIVGSRTPVPKAVEFTRNLARTLAEAGIVVVSGGALGIDTAAHEGAMEGGATWCVAPNGRAHPSPPQNTALFEAIAASKRSRMIWPFDDDQRKDHETPKIRNRILVALARVVVVVQAHFASGSRNAATHARRLERPLYVVPAAPWDTRFVGSLLELASGGARMLVHPSQLFREVGLPWTESRGWPASPLEQLSLPNLDPQEEAETDRYKEGWTDAEKSVFSALSTTVQHVDEVIARTGLPTSATITALLTLSLKDVVVESPDGFYRRRK